MWDETWFIASKHVAFTGNTDSSQDIVTSAHNIANSCLVQLGNHTRSTWLQFVLENDEAQEFEVGFGLSSCHLLDFHPAQLPFVFAGTGNHTVSFVSVVA